MSSYGHQNWGFYCPYSSAKKRWRLGILYDESSNWKNKERSRVHFAQKQISKQRIVFAFAQSFEYKNRSGKSYGGIGKTSGQKAHYSEKAAPKTTCNQACS